MIIILKGFIQTRRVRLNGWYLSPVESQKMINHSPDGFMWGYSGSGPAQLALAVLLKMIPANLAVKHYQTFKSDIIAKLNKDKDFEITIDLKPYEK